MLPFSDGYTELRQHFSQKTAWLCIPEECGEAILRVWISRRRPIRVIFSVSVSSSVLTQLPEDGELARFNHPFTQTQTMKITHAAERQVPERSAATALIPHHITRLRLALRRKHNFLWKCILRDAKHIKPEGPNGFCNWPTQKHAVCLAPPFRWGALGYRWQENRKISMIYGCQQLKPGFPPPFILMQTYDPNIKTDASE